MIEVKSLHNPVIKELKSLKTKKGRDKSGSYFIEGARFLEDAFQEKQHIQSIYISDSVASNISTYYENKAKLFDIPLYQLPEKLFHTITDTVSPQGILAVVSYQKQTVEALFQSFPIHKILMLDQLQDPGNMGTIIRSADAFGFDTIFALKGSVDIYNPKVLRSTMGAIFRVHCVQDLEVSSVFSLLRSYSFSTYAASVEQANSLVSVPFQYPLCLVIGNEAHGISSDVVSMCNHKIMIPMQGNIESLNASMAASILMYEIYRSQLI